MTSPIFHAESSVRLFGGKVEDYLPIHNWFDETKQHHCGYAHRIFRHHAYGIFECESVFGEAITNSEGQLVPVRYIGEQHVREDCGGFVPTIHDWVKHIDAQVWMSRGISVKLQGVGNESK